jgi:hypothetical protein
VDPSHRNLVFMRRLFKINSKYKGLKRESLSTTMDCCHLFEGGLGNYKESFLYFEH